MLKTLVQVFGCCLPLAYIDEEEIELRPRKPAPAIPLLTLKPQANIVPFQRPISAADLVSSERLDITEMEPERKVPELDITGTSSLEMGCQDMDSKSVSLDEHSDDDSSAELEGETTSASFCGEPASECSEFFVVHAAQIQLAHGEEDNLQQEANDEIILSEDIVETSESDSTEGEMLKRDLDQDAPHEKDTTQKRMSMHQPEASEPPEDTNSLSWWGDLKKDLDMECNQRSSLSNPLPEEANSPPYNEESCNSAILVELAEPNQPLRLIKVRYFNIENPPEACDGESIYYFSPFEKPIQEASTSQPQLVEDEEGHSDSEPSFDLAGLEEAEEEYEEVEYWYDSRAHFMEETHISFDEIPSTLAPLLLVDLLPGDPLGWCKCLQLNCTHLSSIWVSLNLKMELVNQVLSLFSDVFTGCYWILSALYSCICSRLSPRLMYVPAVSVVLTSVATG